jgi:hypothetical protein
MIYFFHLCFELFHHLEKTTMALQCLQILRLKLKILNVTCIVQLPQNYCAASLALLRLHSLILLSCLRNKQWQINNG